MSIMHSGSETNRKNYEVYFSEYSTKLKGIVNADIALSLDSKIPDT